MSTVQDPVCGMLVDPATTEWHSTHDGTTYHFCAAGCKQAFDADPARYVTAAAAGATRERHEPPFTVTGDVAAPKFGAAGSGGAEYEMLPEAHDHRSK
jgi:Cu+-exporting ATPase